VAWFSNILDGAEIGSTDMEATWSLTVDCVIGQNN